MASKTTRVKIAQKPHIEEAKRMAKDGMPTGQIEIYADDATSGLQLRVQGKRAFWVLKYGSATKTLGFVFAEKAPHRLITAVTEARELAAEAKKVLDDDPKKFDPFLSTYYAIQNRDPEQARKEARGQVTTWTLRQCIEYVIEDRTKPDAKEPLKNPYELTLTLKRSELKTLLDQPVATMDRGDFDDARELLKDRYGKSAANKAISNVRSSLDYCMRFQSKSSGLSHKDKWWKLIESAGSVGSRNRVPSVDDIVKIMIVLEDFLTKPLPGRKARDGKAGVRANVFAAAWWLVLTGQRTFAALHLRRHDLFPDKEAAPGWYLAAWPEGVMKASVDFVLPIPPRVVQHMLPLIDASRSEVNDGSAWAFASGRKAKKKTANKDITVNQSAVRQALARLRGRDPLMKDDKGKVKADAVDFFEKLRVPWWTPHTIRAGLGKKLDQAGIPGGSSAVLAHKIKMPERPANDRQHEEWLEQHVEDITAQAYHNPAHMTLKSKAMLVWTDAILDRYEQLSPRAQARIAEEKRTLRAKYVFKDAQFVDEALVAAKKAMLPLIDEQQAKIERTKRMIEKMMTEEPVPLKDITETKVYLGDYEFELDRLENRPGNLLIKPSEEARARNLAAVIDKGYAAYDFRSEAPEYCALRDRYITGQITLEQMKSTLSDEHGYDFSMGTMSMYLPGREPVSAVSG